MEKIIIYTSETCPYCKQVKEELTKNEIKFENRLTKDFKDEWQNIVSLTGMAQVPTVLYKNNYFIAARDYANPPYLVNILKNFKPNNSPIQEQLLEKTKTLAYNIQTGFGRLDQLLRKIENKLNTEEKDEHKSND